MLCNEPHFITSKKANGQPSWAGTGVSGHSMEKFKDSLESKHQTIEKLNAIWKTSFASFDEVSLDIPMSVGMRGTPQWYDWMRFNMDRVSSWYQWMGNKIKESDPSAKIHLKFIPGQWTGNARDHGLDFEFLTSMSDIIGNDAGTTHRSAPWKTEDWEEDYLFEWRELAMGYDFFKSIHPDKINFNSESHFLSKAKSLNLWLDPKHARATYWLATVMGMSASQTWYWARRIDGSARNQNDKGYGASNNHQPRVTNEVHATMMDLNAHSEEIIEFQRRRKPIRIFYSETSAINKADYMDDLFELYESLFFKGVPVGFVTKNILKEQNPEAWDVVAVYKTEYATQEEINAVQDYINAGGKVIVDGASFAKNEYGGPMNGIAGASTISGLGAMSSAALGLAPDAPANKIEFKEKSKAGHRICTWQVIGNAAGNKVLSVMNVGKVDATVAIKLKNTKKGTASKDLLKGIDIPNTNVLKPYDVLFVELRDEPSPFEEILGAPGPPTGKMIYPNPTRGKTYIDFGARPGKAKVQVLDLLGRVREEKVFHNSKKVSLDIGHLKPGVYLVKISVPKRESTIQLIKI